MAFKNYLIFLLVMCGCIPTIAQTTGTLPDKPVNVLPADSNKSTVVRICTPSRGQIIAEPLIVVFAGGKEVLHTRQADSTINTINPQDIASINVLKGVAATNKYGKDAEAGVIEIQMRDGKYPGNYKPAKQDTSKKGGTAIYSRF